MRETSEVTCRSIADHGSFWNSKTWGDLSTVSPDYDLHPHYVRRTQSTSADSPRTFHKHSCPRNTIRIRTTSATFQPCPHRVRINFEIEIHVRTASAKINPRPHRIRADAVRSFADYPRTQIRGFVRKCPPPRCSLLCSHDFAVIVSAVRLDKASKGQQRLARSSRAYWIQCLPGSTISFHQSQCSYVKT